jgi:putative acetyltransferase
MNVKYRRAIFHDAARLCELRRESILELAPQRGMLLVEAKVWAAKMTIARMEQRIREVEVWVAEVSDTIVGWVAIRGEHLDGLYIEPAFVEQGIGTRLLNLAEQLMRDAGVQVVHLEASCNAEGFYLQRGYEPAGPRLARDARPFVKRLMS